MYELYLSEARPQWNLVDQRGPVPTTLSGMLRQPVPLMHKLYAMWLATYPDEPEVESKADAVAIEG